MQGIFISSGMRLVIPQSTAVSVRMSTGQVRHSWLLSINTCIDLPLPRLESHDALTLATRMET